MTHNNFLLWESDEFAITTPLNPHIPYSEGLHLVVAPKFDLKSAWENPEVSGKLFKLATQACNIMADLNFAPWFNLQANGNWGLLPGSQPFFHIHIYGRNKTANWGKPIVLPVAPNTYQNEPMPEADRNTLAEAFKQLS